MLRNQLHMHKINLKWIPHELSITNKAKRVALAKKLLTQFQILGSENLDAVYTQDESWIYFSKPHKSMWLENSYPIPTQPKKTVASKKAMISVFWSRSGIKLLTMLPQNQSFTKNFYENYVLRKLDITTGQKIFFHCDNSRIHLCPEVFKQLGIERLEHPPYSPDIAPSDFFLFGFIKKLIEGMNFKDENDLYQKISETLHSIPKQYFINAYNEWLKRLEEVIKLNGEYIIK